MNRDPKYNWIPDVLMLGDSPVKGWLARYATALLAIAVAVPISLALNALRVPISGIVFIFIAGVLFAAYIGGYGPGVLTTLVFAFGGPVLMGGHLNFAHFDWGRPLLVLTISLLVSKVAQNRVKTEASLRAMNEQLDRRVLERTEELRRANAALVAREGELLAQTEDLQRSNTDLSYFAYVASHDMQEPLRMIGIYAELLKRRHSYHLDRDGQHLLSIIVSGADRLQRLVADLLRFANVNRGPAGSTEPVDMNAAVRVSLENIAQAINESGARIDIETLPHVECDAAQISQVFQNLISNAIKYRGERTPAITVNAALTPEGWVFAVRDNGVGIKPEYHQTVFAPFKRLHGQEVPGSGIGLAICRRIIERHGGRIWVESQDGSGSTFRFVLPHRASAQAAAG